jgi:UDP-2,3-diacylglucosamine pyrophosphatase LpxH
MSKKKTVFISDVHLGPGNNWDWFNIDKEGPYLVQFFEYLLDRQTKVDDIKELVLLGDLFDLWVCPHDQAPHTLSDIVTAQHEVIDAIKKTAAKVHTLYVNGNHDFRVTKQHIDEIFEGSVKHIGNVYRRGNIHAEHGHKFALFNYCPDLKNGGTRGLPLGYYISRLHTSLGEGRKAKTNLIIQVADELLQMVGTTEKLPESVLDAMKDAVENTNKTKVTDFNMGENVDSHPYEKVRERYQNLFDDWVKAKGLWFATQMIMSELNRLGTVADQLCRDGVNIVVFGHSHDTKMDKDSWFVEDRIYANCGYWCGFGDQEKIEDNAHFVQTDKETVELFRFAAGEIEPRESFRL